MAKKYISKYTGPEIDSGLDNIPKLEGKLTELESKEITNGLILVGKTYTRNLEPGLLSVLDGLDTNSRDGIIRFVGHSDAMVDIYISAFVGEDRKNIIHRVTGDFDVTTNFTSFAEQNDIIDNIYIQIISVDGGTGVFEISKVYASQNIAQGLILDSATEEIEFISKELFGKIVNYKNAEMPTRILNGDGSVGGFTDFYTSVAVDIDDNYRYLMFSDVYSLDAGKVFCGLALYDDSDNAVAVFGTKGVVDLEKYPSAVRLRYCHHKETNPVVVGLVQKPTSAELEKINSLFNFTDSDIYGNNQVVSNSPFGTSDYMSLATTSNSQSKMSGMLKNIVVYSSAAGTMKFAVGLLDQRNQAVISSTFDLSVSKGLNSINVESLKIPISKGEQVFVYIGYYGDAILTWVTNRDAVEHEMLYGKTEITRLPTEFGGSVTLAYQVTEIDSLFAQKSEVEQTTNQLNSVMADLNKVGIIYDNLGNPYKLKVVNGGVIPVSLLYKKVVALGNSLTFHEIAGNIGYYGDGWAMAASVKENSWTDLLQEVLRQKSSNASVIPHNIYKWEMDYLNVDLSELLDNVLTDDVDLVIFRAGENGNATDNYAEGVDRLITYVMEKCPAATIVMTSMFWHNATKENAMRSVANKYGLTYIYTENVGSHACRMGDYTMGGDGQLYPIVNAGVAAHMNDVGFALWTNILANAFGYAPLNYIHNVSVVDNNNIGYVAFSQWVYRGIFNIQTNASVVSVKAGNQSISVKNMGDGVWTFIMPNENVVINIS